MKKEKYIYVGDFQVGYLGRLSSLDLHSHVTWTLCLRIMGDFQVNFKGKLYSVDQAAIIPPKFKHSIYAEDSLILFLFFEKHNKYFRNLYGDNEIHLLKDEFLSRYQNDFLDPNSLSKDRLKERFESLMEKFRPIEKQKIHMDEKILNVLQILDSWSKDSEPTLKQLSYKVLVSESRLSHLFSQEMGVPISSYKIWKKIKRLAVALQSGSNLTEASQHAGFYDSSHFNRVFTQFFGINPKNVFLDAVVHWIT
ncbi:MAG: helix-turn-helix transcriptional regulator [Leptospira sp.]|nr:helix-turn-helix transcriptional regulator [Leptospira sp.]